MDEWIKFEGRAIDRSDSWILETSQGDGSLAVQKCDVRLTASDVQIRRGAVVQVLRAPQGGGRPASIDIPTSDCPCGRTRCIGFVLICCEDQRVIGTGLGYWDECPSEDYVP